jgi:hypothetical protein
MSRFRRENRAMRALTILGVLAILASGTSRGQSFTFVPEDTVLSAPVGTEIVFNCTIRNTSASTLILRIIRSVNNLPQSWESAMCVTACYPPEVDSIVAPQMNPGDTLPFSMHIYSLTNAGTGVVQVISSNIHNPADQRVLTFTGNGTATDVSLSRDVPAEFSLQQNYPNPFNPSTTIEYKTVNAGFVTLKVYDVLGNEISTLVNHEMFPGTHRVVFEGKGLSSGVYVARLQMDNRVESKRLVLIK